jgi:glutathione peroxidase
MQTSAVSHAAENLHSLKVKGIDGQEVSLSTFKGKTLLIVNTASRCGYTPQYEGLEALYKKYKDKGFVVLGFPSNDFGAQEPGSNAEIKKFCQTKFNVDFPMFAKGEVKGEGKQPLFALLTQAAPSKGEIKWNFEKFLIDPSGQVVARFDSKVTPTDEALNKAIVEHLPSGK